MGISTSTFFWTRRGAKVANLVLVRRFNFFFFNTCCFSFNFKVADLCVKFRISLRLYPLNLITFIDFLLLIVPALISVAFLTLLERKILGVVGYRLGPYKVRVGGVLQPIGDAAKLANKSYNSLFNISFFYYYLSGSFILFCSLFLWFTLFSEPSPNSLKYSLLVVLVILGFNSFNSVFSGWRTLRKYTLIGRIRTVAQLISYEAVLYLCVLFHVFCYYSFNLFSMNFLMFKFFFLVSPFLFYIWVPSILAELNRTPYDFSEGERELVSGFNTEFGSSVFTLTFLGEYSNIIFLSLLTYFLFFYANFRFFFVVTFFVIWIRSVLPRFRFDKLMFLCWKFFVPFITVIFIYFLILFF